ncbi:glycosyltransferase family 2 protein [Shewanella sp.]|uniref:glycosyltransferase family 2 protein n=1 Tax=Shewanella sp. TaxID=50422 RepID=UPI003D0EF649
MFTVIIPAYNASSTIKRCLESICIQDLNLVSQVIIVDDFSSDYDSLSNEVDNFRNRLNILLVRNESNKNGAYSRNVGINKANSLYVAFLDADDFWLSGHLLKYYNEIKLYSDEESIIYYSPFILCDSDGNERDVRPYRSINEGELVSEYVFFHSQHMQTSTFVVDLKTAKNIQFNDALTRHQDSDFMMRAQKCGAKIIFISEATSRYIFSNNDLLKRVSKGRISSIWCDYFLNSHLEFFNEKAKYGYLLNVKCRILYIEKKYYILIKCLMEIIKGIGVNQTVNLIFNKLFKKN